MNINDIYNEMGFKKCPPDRYSKNYYFSGVFATGNFDCIGDYGVGLLEIRIKDQLDLSYPILTIGTIDDGVWQAYGNKKIDISVLVNDIEKTFGVQLPTENDFNDFLSKYGLFGTYTG